MTDTIEGLGDPSSLLTELARHRKWLGVLAGTVFLGSFIAFVLAVGSLLLDPPRLNAFIVSAPLMIWMALGSFNLYRLRRALGRQGESAAIQLGRVIRLQAASWRLNGILAAVVVFTITIAFMWYQFGGSIG